MRLDEQTRRQLRDMGCTELLDAFVNQDEDACAALDAGQRIRLAVDEAHAAFTDKRIGGLARRARLRYPQADLRTLDMLDERGISRELVASLADCSWVERHRNIVAQGYCGSGKSWIICALARQACRNRYRARYIRIPDLEEEWRQAADKPQGRSRLLKRYSAYTVLALDEWLFDPPEERFRAFLFELMERRHDTGSTLFATQYPQKDRHQRLGGGTHADAIMDRSAQHHLAGNRRLQHEGTRTRPVAANQSRKQGWHRQCPIPSTPVPSHNNPSAESE